MSQSGVYGTGGSGGGGITKLAGDVGTASGSTVNVITGFQSGTPFFTGDNASTLTWQIEDAHNNVGLGNGALLNAESFSGVTFNTAVGDSVANGIGANCTYNCFFGASAGANLGNRSGGANYNIAIGNLSIYQANSSASYNIGIGYLAGGNLQSTESSNIYLNSPGVTSESNTLRIGASSGTGNQQLSTAYVSGIHFVDLSTVEMVTVSGGDQLGSSTLTAGSGISITPGSGVITIASTGSGGIITIDGDSGSVTGSTVTISGGAPTNGTATFVASGSTLFLFFDNSTTRNLGLGDQALVDIAAGQDNVAIGTGSGSTLGSGSSNTLIGSSVGSSLTTGSNNCLLGALAGNSYATGTESGNILINNQGVNGENNVLRIGSGTGSSGQELTNAYISGISGVNVGSVASVVSISGDHLGSTTITAGAGISVTAGANTITIATTSSVGNWVNVVGNSQTMVADTGYVANDSVLVTFTLPATAAFGTIMWVVGNGTGGWTIAQNAGQSVVFGSAGATTVGVAGSLSSTNRYDTVQILCVVANTTWNVLTSAGNITIV